jgi:hypothetical protein
VVKLSADVPANNNRFGYSVDISGDTVVVGAYGDAGSGSAYLFQRNQGGADSWGQAQKLTAADAADNDYFGCSVGISGATIVVGATWDDDNGNSSGSAYIFERNQGGADDWGEVTKLTASNAEGGDSFGDSVSISGETVVIGAHGKSAGRGAAYLFRLESIRIFLPLVFDN